MSGTHQQVPVYLSTRLPPRPSNLAYKQEIPWNNYLKMFFRIPSSTHNDFVWIIVVFAQIAGGFNIQYKKSFIRLFDTWTWNWCWSYLLSRITTVTHPLSGRRGAVTTSTGRYWDKRRPGGRDSMWHCVTSSTRLRIERTLNVWTLNILIYYY